MEKQSCRVAEAIGSETGKNERELRKSIIRCADELRLEMKQGFGRHETELMKLREIRESAQSDLKLSLLDVRKELLEIRKQIAELRVSRSKALNGGGGGLHADH